MRLRRKPPARRPLVGEAKEAWPALDVEQTRIGICCSGGGIRSASYCLGALQVLREESVLEQADYVSAVSGGSYIASAFASAAARAADDGGVPVFAPGSAEETHLRNNSSYMAPDTAGKALLLLRVVGGAVWHLFLLSVLVFIVFWPASFIYAHCSAQLAGKQADGFVLHHLGLWIAVALFPLVCGLFLTGELWEADQRRPWADRMAWRVVLASGLLAAFLVVIPQGVLAARAVGGVPLGGLGQVLGGTGDAKHGSGLLGLVGGLAGLTAIGGALSTFVSQRRRILLHLAAFLAGPLVVLSPILIVVNWGSTLHVAWWFVAPWLGAVVFMLVVEFRLDLTQWSLHPFYRRRLCSAFYTRRVAARSDGKLTAEPVPKDLRWRELAQASSSFPPLLVCASANVTKVGETPPGRSSMPFVFSREKVGVPGHAARLENLSARWQRLTVAEAVAMSGAAVSPLMGKKTIRAVRFLMGLMNVRLGVWMPNPMLGADAPDGGARPHMLIKEMLGLARTDDPYLYVTDGGHFDNLGLVELLRRGCNTVFCLDGGGDPPGDFRALGEAVALSRSELQVDVEVDPMPIAPAKDTRVAQRGFALGTLRFRASPDGAALPNDETGRIVYCRAAVTEDAPWDVREFALRDKRFPFHSTMDQLFTDEKFESYRALGAHTARTAVAAWRRETLRDKVLEVLRERARARVCLTYADLVGHVSSELTAVDLPALPSLLDEIASEEAAAKRPPLILVVQEGELHDPELTTGLDAVFRYWEAAALPADRAGRRTAPRVAGPADI